ncbi:MAG: PEP/pyruvate-binding domain-containing protein [Propionibacteriaceae bacterium]
MGEYIVVFGPEEPARNLSLARGGGKAVNLVRLASRGFPVPPGFIATTVAYEAVVAANGLDAVVTTELRTVQGTDPDSLERASALIRAAFEAAAVPADIAAAIRTALVALGEGPVAVRSSATAEDLADASFAGQQDTYLNVLGADAVLDAVLRCWGSLWTARAIGYRTRAGIAHDDVSLAVVVQRQIASEASGVAFTADPLSGRRDRVVIDATLGLGEALVSGQVVPDHFVCTHSGRVLEETHGDKAVVTVALLGGGTETRERSGHAWALDDEQAAGVARLAVAVEQEYGFPQDIEWAIADGTLWLLQARAITSLYELPEDINTPNELGMWASFGSFQGMLAPITPIGQDAIFLLMRGIYRLLGAPLAPDVTLATSPIVRLAGERLWIRLDPAYRTGFGHRLVPGMFSIADPAMGALVASLDEPRWEPRGGLPSGAARRLGSLARKVLPGLLRSFHDPVAVRTRLEQDCDRLVSNTADRFRHASDVPGAEARLHTRIAAIHASLESAFPILLVRFGPIMPVGVGGMAALRRLGGPEALEVIRSLDGNVTTEMDLALWGAAEKIRADAEARDAVLGQRTDEVAAAFLVGSLPGVAQRALGEFLELYGMRAVGEIDLGRARWSDDPASAIASLQAYVGLPDDAPGPAVEFERGKEVAAAATRRLAEKLASGGPRGRLQATVVRRLVRTIRGDFGARETPKFTLVKQFGMVRDALLESGRDLVQVGRLDDPYDVMYCHLGDLQQAWDLPYGDLKRRVAANKESYARESRRRQIPRLLLGDGRTFYEGLADVDGDIAGSPVSPGVVEGRVRVVLSPASAGLQEGEILVCPGTDPAWTPLFLTAGGLVTEVGGLMTHGSVVAREYGIPAVVGVHAATERLVTGQLIRLDGSTGRITLLDE